MKITLPHQVLTARQLGAHSPHTFSYRPTFALRDFVPCHSTLAPSRTKMQCLLARKDESRNGFVEKSTDESLSRSSSKYSLSFSFSRYRLGGLQPPRKGEKNTFPYLSELPVAALLLVHGSVLLYVSPDAY